MLKAKAFKAVKAEPIPGRFPTEPSPIPNRISFLEQEKIRKSKVIELTLLKKGIIRKGERELARELRIPLAKLRMKVRKQLMKELEMSFEDWMRL